MAPLVRAKPPVIYYVRHGLTDWNVQQRLQGRLDVPLNAEGCAQATRCGEILCDLLARDFAPGTGWVALQLQVIEDPLLAEATNVLYDGRSYDERKRASAAINLVHGNRMQRTEVLKRVTDAAVAMKKANAALAQAVESSAWSAQDIQAFAERAQSLRAAVKIIVKE